MSRLKSILFVFFKVLIGEIMGYQTIFNFLTDYERQEILDHLDNLEWEKGRQGTGYEKAVVPLTNNVFQALAKRSLHAMKSSFDNVFDCFILKYPLDSFIPDHRDPAPEGKEHWRFNAIVSGTDPAGSPHSGRFFIEDREVDLREKDAIIFRPDRYVHSVSSILYSPRYVWSVGTLKDS